MPIPPRSAARPGDAACRGGGACLRSASRSARRAGAAPLLLPRDGVALFRAALAVVMVAVADDAFIHPEPATPPATTSRAGSCRWRARALLIAFARAAAGPRARLARDLRRSLSIVGGATDGVRHIVVDRVSGDDVTAVLAGVAGIVARRARHRDVVAYPPHAAGRRFLRRAGIGAAVIVLIALVVLPTGIAIVATHKARSPSRRRRSRPAPPRRRPDDERRAASARVVRPLAQRRRRHRLPRPRPSRSRTRAC